MWVVFYGSITEAIFYDHDIGNAIGDPWDEILRRKHLLRDHRMIDEFKLYANPLVQELKTLFENGTYDEVLGFVEWTLRNKTCPPDVVEGVTWALAEAMSAYRVYDEDTIGLVGTEEEARAIACALDAASAAEFSGAKTHLKNAVQFLSAGKWADSIRESIHSVEFVARRLAPAATTLDPALKELAKAKKIHPALKAGFGNLYGFASDEKGIRHPLIDEPVAAIEEADAMYMLGASAAFVSYLIAKSLTESERLAIPRKASFASTCTRS